MYPFGGSLVSSLVAAYCASLISRALRRREKRPGWLSGGVSVAVGIFIGWLCVFQLDLFRPSRWDAGKVELPVMLVITGFVSFIASVIPAAFVVVRHQKIYDSTHPMAS
jgi:membrane-bound metal-dependent hydrolase YbcI (DUF457 family)